MICNTTYHNGSYCYFGRDNGRVLKYQMNNSGYLEISAFLL